MRIAQAQMNSRLGDFAGNSEKILSLIEQALEQGCELIVFPECCLFGYLPIDLLESKNYVDHQLKEFKKIEKRIPKGIAALIGLITYAPKASGKAFYNSAALVQKGIRSQFFNKQLLPSYDIFDEARFFAQGETRKNIFSLNSNKFLVTICEDIWAWGVKGYPTQYNENPLLKIKEKRLAAVINMSASPFYLGKLALRYEVVGAVARHFNVPVIYTNMVGAQDEVIFDGGSFVVNSKAQLAFQAPRFEESLQIFELAGAQQTPLKKPIKKTAENQAQNLFLALVVGIRDFLNKTGFQKVHLGLSGGIDSAVVLCLAVEAMGAANVKAFALPGPFSSKESLVLAQSLAKNLGVEIFQAEIQSAYDASLKAIEKSTGPIEFGAVNENLQSRLRSIFLMAYSNKENSLLLTTGNKSELATGYATLYGDMSGALNPLGDLLKFQVYELANLINIRGEVIPAEIISRAPTAELRPNQKDQDSLPPYPELDKAVQNLVEKSLVPKTKTEIWLAEKLAKSEFKRWQAPPILKVTSHAFGRGRRMPIASKMS